MHSIQTMITLIWLHLCNFSELKIMSHSPLCINIETPDSLPSAGCVTKVSGLTSTDSVAAALSAWCRTQASGGGTPKKALAQRPRAWGKPIPCTLIKSTTIILWFLVKGSFTIFRDLAQYLSTNIYFTLENLIKYIQIQIYKEYIFGKSYICHKKWLRNSDFIVFKRFHSIKLKFNLKVTFNDYNLL